VLTTVKGRFSCVVPSRNTLASGVNMLVTMLAGSFSKALATLANCVGIQAICRSPSSHHSTRALSGTGVSPRNTSCSWAASCHCSSARIISLAVSLRAMSTSFLTSIVIQRASGSSTRFSLPKADRCRIKFSLRLATSALVKLPNTSRSWGTPSR